jgi:DHA1 family tetracycline resistance protein-like MFS transporter
MQKSRLLTIFVIVFIDLLGFGLILPLLPYFADTFNASSTVVGLLVASYAMAQLIGVPMLGRLSDRYGRRPILMVSAFGTLIGFLLLGFANSLWMLFASRIIDGLTGGNISVARAYITDITDEKNRAKGLGLIGAAFGLGFVIGPAVGGILSAGGHYSIPAFAAATLTTLNLIAMYFWLTESLTPERRQAMSQKARAAFNWHSLWDAFQRPGVGPLLHITFVYSLAFVTFEGIFTLYAQKRLGLESHQTGYLLAYMGILVVIVQGGVIGRLAARYSEAQLMLAASVLLTLSLLGWAFASSVLALMIILVPLSLGAGIMMTAIHSAISKSVQPDEIGGTMGLSAGLESVTRAIGPALGGVLLDAFGTWAPGIFSALLMLWVVTFVWRRLFLKHISVPSEAPAD